MTKQDFQDLKPGDIVENRHGQRFVLIPNGYPIEPVTQIRRIALEHDYANWMVVAKGKG